jgi:hypothetical protein
MSFAIVQKENLYVCLWIHTSKDPLADEFEAACQEIEALRRRDPTSVGRTRALVISDGGAPSMTQRARHNVTALKNMPMRMAGVTIRLSNSLVRGIARAVTWTNPAFKVFAPAQWQSALSHVDMPGRTDLFVDIRKMHLASGLPTNKTLDAIEEAMTPRPPTA